MDLSSSINFRNYIFEEQNNQLIISKNQQAKTNDFAKLIQQIPCSKLVRGYTLYLRQKQKELSDFHPNFASTEASQTFSHWYDNQTAKITQKIKDPLETLRAKVTKRCEQLFQEKGQRSVLLGCGHVQTGVIQQTHTSLDCSFPQFITKKEDHRHDRHVCVDWRADVNEKMEFNIGAIAMADPTSFPHISPNGPDFSRRQFENPTLMKDFSQLKNVQHFHAERVPFLEKGICEDNAFLLQQILNALAPGGIFSFDFGIDSHLLSVWSKPLLNECEERAFADTELCEKAQTIYSAKVEEVFADHEYLNVLDFAIQAKIVAYENSDEDITPKLLKMEVNRRTEEVIKNEFYEKQRNCARELTKKKSRKSDFKPGKYFSAFW